MSVLNEKVRNQIIEILKQLENSVNIVFFTQEHECNFCKDTRQFLEEVASLSGKLDLIVHDFVLDNEKAEKYAVDKIPAIVILDKDYADTGIKFYGLPGGYEINSFLGSLLEVSGRKDAMPADIAQRIGKIDKDIHIQVFVTLTCPYCPSAVATAHRLALESKKIRADMIDTAAFPPLSNRYQVMSVPKIVINESHFLEGAVPVTEFLNLIEKI